MGKAEGKHKGMEEFLGQFRPGQGRKCACGRPHEIKTKMVTLNFEANTVAQKLSDSHSLCTLVGMFRWEGSTVAAPPPAKGSALRQISTALKNSVTGYGCTVEERSEKGKTVWYARAEIKPPQDKTAGKLTCSFACINAVYYK